MSHVYPGARYKGFQLWSDKPNRVFFDILERNKDKIIIELAGHDHFADLRTSANMERELFHNMLVAPSITPWYRNNPGVTSFEITDDFVPQSLRSTFLNLKATYGRDGPFRAEDLEFRELDFEKQYGIKEMTPDEIWALAYRLTQDHTLHKDYLIRKMGLDPEIKSEVEQAVGILLEKELIDVASGGMYSMWPQICVMTANKTEEEFKGCLKAKDRFPEELFQ